jgi:hypothetical protein
MQKLLLLLILSVGFPNYSLAGVEDISIKCKGSVISTVSITGGNLGKYRDKLEYTNTSNPPAIKGYMYVIGESSNSVKVSFDNGFRYRNLLEDGVYKLSDTEPSGYWFRKELTLDGKKGKSSFRIDREDGYIWQVRFDIEADRPLTYDVHGHSRDSSSRIAHDYAAWMSKYEGCEKFTQLF